MDIFTCIFKNPSEAASFHLKLETGKYSIQFFLVKNKTHSGDHFPFLSLGPKHLITFHIKFGAHFRSDTSILTAFILSFFDQLIG